MLKLAFRNIFRNRMRTGLTLAAILSGVSAIILSGGFVEDVFIQLREAFQAGYRPARTVVMSAVKKAFDRMGQVARISPV